MVPVFIVEDHHVVIEGIQSLLQNEKNIKILGYANTAAECMNYLATGKAEVILMDISLPDMSGIELCKLIKTKYKKVMVLALSTFNEGIYMNKMMENGASGYLLKNVTRQELIDGITTVS